MKFSFFSTCDEVWGGSEELWSAVAARLAGLGHTVRAYKTRVTYDHPKISRLTDSGCLLHELHNPNYPLPIRILNRILPHRLRYRPEGGELAFVVKGHLRSFQPHLTVVSQGENFDGVHLAEMCRQLTSPYVTICQKASDLMWPDDQRRDLGRRAYGAARRCYFVSQNNRHLTEGQLGMSLTQSEVVRNPVLAGARGPLAWPAQVPFHRWACVARLWVLDKGQDLLLNVLAQPKWRSRPLMVSLVGQGVQGEALLGRATQLGLSNIEFLGQISDIESVWAHHHMLILPSRAEGLPLAAVEAMMCGRPCVLTDVGGNAELIKNDQTGFLAGNASESALDEAMERAWRCRGQWSAMGEEAARQVRNLVDHDPAMRLTRALIDLALSP